MHQYVSIICFVKGIENKKKKEIAATPLTGADKPYYSPLEIQSAIRIKHFK